ncbi:hypothetical protein GG681_17560 [Epibacterium sp. SM1969]|uniref:Uncharacterized protein n=1 Tax=Tritonibacter aquimaris TaxID=2663379 RepID=A0A844B1P5_9RHOB|nr:DUF6634 family protein [Tritonibacter aquimaris]MQY44454.1 hypothetical protein [Tritonibacter aquimaris]
MTNNITPSRADLDQAPRLECWRVISGLEATWLRGEVTGHPILHDQRINTSPLLALNKENKWARTRSRFYVLGEPAFKPPTELERARYKKRLAEHKRRLVDLSKCDFPHGLYQLSNYPTIARIVVRRSVAMKLDGRTILAVVKGAHPSDLAAMTEDEREFLDLLRVRENGVVF